MFGEYFFQTLEANLPYKGVFFKIVVNANILAFIMTTILRRVVHERHPLHKCQPLEHSAMSAMMGVDASDIVTCLRPVVRLSPGKRIIPRSCLEIGSFKDKSKHIVR